MIKGQNIVLQGNNTVSLGMLGVLSIVSGAQVCLTQSRIGAATCSCGSGLKASSMQSTGSPLATAALALAAELQVGDGYIVCYVQFP